MTNTATSNDHESNNQRPLQQQSTTATAKIIDCDSNDCIKLQQLPSTTHQPQQSTSDNGKQPTTMAATIKCCDSNNELL